jgi:hypothetical protein
MVSAVPGLGSLSGVLHLAARRPYVAALAVAVLAAVAFIHPIVPTVPALATPPVPEAPIVQHTPRPPAIREHIVQHALGHRENPAAKHQSEQKQGPVV